MPTCPALSFLPAATRSNPCDHSQVYHFSLALWAVFGAIKEFLAIIEHMMDCCVTAQSLPELATTDMSWTVMNQKTKLHWQLECNSFICAECQHTSPTRHYHISVSKLNL